MGLQDLLAEQLRPAEIRAQSGAPARRRAAALTIPKSKAHDIADEALHAVAGRGRHDWYQWSHVPVVDSGRTYNRNFNSECNSTV